ncbi:hypothetical protein LJC35_04705 [Parabacteroides sp. OttesenSCG-928-N08]|nr:hypothetical protein [Parabacteroides sp. OttesenSCG-928-N08]
MKAVFITFNQAHHHSIIQIMDRNNIRGYTYWEQVQGRGMEHGEPHYGSHAWPTLNSAIIAMVEDHKVDTFLDLLHQIDTKTEMLGLRAFVWNVEKMV